MKRLQRDLIVIYTLRAIVRATDALIARSNRRREDQG